MTGDWPITPVRDPDADALVELMQSSGQPALWERGVEGARAYLDQRAADGAPGPDLERVDDLSIPADPVVRVRVYRPESIAPLPVVVYLHGGGWVIGGVAASDAFCRRLAVAGQCVVVSVEYRLAPENPFPAGLDDACAAIRWAAEHGGDVGADPTRLIVVGDSAGGNLATVATRLVGAEGVDISRQILAYPVVAGDVAFPPQYHQRVWPLTEQDRQWFLESYVPDGASASHADIAPLNGELGAMPPTTILLGGCDPLFGEGMAYARALINAGVSVDLHLYAGQFHGFLTMDDAVLPTARQAIGVVAGAINAGAR